MRPVGKSNPVQINSKPHRSVPRADETKIEMIDLSNKTCVVLDHGMFLELALRLARDFGHVYYVDPLWEESFAKLNHALIGDGFDEIERVKEIWDVIDQVDLAVFPDTFNSAMQEYIAQSGIPVWGGGAALIRWNSKRSHFAECRKAWA